MNSFSFSSVSLAVFPFPSFFVIGLCLPYKCPPLEHDTFSSVTCSSPFLSFVSCTSFLFFLYHRSFTCIIYHKASLIPFFFSSIMHPYLFIVCDMFLICIPTTRSCTCYYHVFILFLLYINSSGMSNIFS